MPLLPPMNLLKWIEDNRQFLKPPVGNRLVYQDTDFMIMVVGGPNNRKDFHVNPTEEFFYQIKGDIVLKTKQENHFHDIEIKSGDIFLLPPMVPHSPKRPADSIGLVIEKTRSLGQLDSFQWYCDPCQSLVYQESFQLQNIVEQLPPLFERFYQSTQNSTCLKCQTRVLK